MCRNCPSWIVWIYDAVSEGATWRCLHCSEDGLLDIVSGGADASVVVAAADTDADAAVDRLALPVVRECDVVELADAVVAPPPLLPPPPPGLPD